MAEYPMDLGSRLPRIHQELIHVARHDDRDPAYAERLARSLEQRNAHLWDDINVEATRLSDGKPVRREEIMRFGMHVVDLFDRAIAVESLEPTMDISGAEAAVPKRRLRSWFAGQAALVGLIFSTERRKSKNGDAFLN